MSSDPSDAPFWNSQTARWAACFVLALGFHAAGAAALYAHLSDDTGLPPNAPTLIIDFAPEAASPNDTPMDAPPDQVVSKPQEIVPEPEPEKPPEKVEIPPDKAPQPELAVIPPPKPIEKPKPKPKVASRAAATQAADQKADRAAAPTSGAQGNPRAVPDWKSAVFSHIVRYKRSVSDAPMGAVVTLGFSIDRSGGVHNVHVVRSSGSSALDQEAVSMVGRASPVPPPPPEMPGSQVPMTAPVRYTGGR